MAVALRGFGTRRTIIFGLIGGALAIVAACKTATSNAAAGGKICTPGAYVFCRCEDRSEGTKLCKADGINFEDCDCGGAASSSGTSGNEGPINFDDGGLEVVDTGPPVNPDNSIDIQCAGKLAVVASSAGDNFLWGAAYTGKGNWTVVNKNNSPNLRSQPHGALVNNSLIVIWRTRFDLIGWTKFDSNQTAITPAVSVGSANTGATPDFVSGAPGGRIVYLGENGGDFADTLVEGTYSAANGWDDATSAIVDAGGPNVPGKSAPVAAAVNGTVVIAYTGTDGSLATQINADGKWGAVKTFAGINAYEETPAITPLGGGSQDALIVYIGNDLLLHSIARTTAGGTWGAPVLIDTAASPDGAPNVTGMTQGRALAAWKAADGTPIYSVYDPSKNPVWSPPGTILAANNITVSAAPVIEPGHCAGDVTATYVDSMGNVGLAFFITGLAGDWRGPYPIPGLTKMTFAGAGETP